MNEIYFTFIYDKSFILYNKKDTEMEKMIKKIIGNFDNIWNKSLLIKKNDWFISLINFKISDKLGFFISITNSNEDKELINNIVSTSFQKFEEIFNNYSQMQINNDIINQINNKIMNQTFKDLVNKYFTCKTEFITIKQDLESTRSITENNIVRFVERSVNLENINENLMSIKEASVKFKNKSEYIKKINFIKKWKLIFLSGILFFIIILFLFFNFKELKK